jgi:hypothetical protein
MQQSEFSSQQFYGETNRRKAGFKKRVLTVRPSLAAPLVWAYRSVAVEVFCLQVPAPCVSVQTVRAVASLGPQLHSLLLAALGAGDQSASRCG